MCHFMNIVCGDNQLRLHTNFNTDYTQFFIYESEKNGILPINVLFKFEKSFFKPLGFQNNNM